MKITEPDIDAFESWLTEDGLTAGTAELYAGDIRRALEGGVAASLQDNELSPNTRRHVLAAWRRYAEFTEDDDLRKSLMRLSKRIPAPRRKLPKIPMHKSDLFLLLDEVDRAEYLSEPMRAHIGLMASRGFRCADVLRMQRAEILRAQETGTLVFEGKGGRRMTFRVLRSWAPYLETLAEYKGYRRVEELVSPLARIGVRKAAKKATERALHEVSAAIGVAGIYPHRLRRTYATEYLRAMGPDPEALVKLQQHMQWASLATAMQYVDHERGAVLDQVAEEMMTRPTEGAGD